MKIVHIIPGSGDQFYCENCVRDGGLIRALRRRGEDVIAAPLYLPVMQEHEDLVADSRVFYGAVNLYISEQFRWWSKLPARLRRVLDTMPVLRFAALRAGSTRASGLDEMTLSMLQGENGRQAGELATLIEWLRAEGRPDIVHLSNALLLGLVGPLKQQLGVPIVCSLQDEDVWVDAMSRESASRVWDLMSEKAKHVDRFVAVSKYYAGKIRSRMKLGEDQPEVIPVGIDLEDYPVALAGPPPVPAIGYLSRLHRDHGLDILVGAFLALKNRPEMRDLQLYVMGGMTPDDRPFVEEQRLIIAQHRAERDVHFCPSFTKQDRIALWPKLTALSVPMPGGEAFGTYMIEAMAGGVPVVQPHTGSFTEIIEDTGGGICFEPTTADALAKALYPLLSDPERSHALGSRGRTRVKEHYDVEFVAARWIRLYRQLVQRNTGN